MQCNCNTLYTFKIEFHGVAYPLVIALTNLLLPIDFAFCDWSPYPTATAGACMRNAYDSGRVTNGLQMVFLQYLQVGDTADKVWSKILTFKIRDNASSMYSRIIDACAAAFLFQ